LTIKTVAIIANIVGALCIVLAIMDYAERFGVWANPDFSAYYENIIVVGLGVILWCFSAIITSLAAIDAKVHEKTN